MVNLSSSHNVSLPEATKHEILPERSPKSLYGTWKKRLRPMKDRVIHLVKTILRNVHIFYI